MFDRHRNKIAGLGAALIASMGLGGAALAANSSKAPSKGPVPAASKAATLSTSSTAPEMETNDTSTAPDKETNDSTAEAAGTETNDAAETPGQESGSEQPGNDGPGGHADEPGNPNADHQAGGNE
jgi:hypothetical protein